MAAATIPILPSPDFDATETFYGQLGFRDAQRWDNYLIIDHPAGIELHFFLTADLDEKTNDHGCYVRFSSDLEAESLYNQWRIAGADDGEIHDIAATDYGLLEFAVLDPHRNLLRIGGLIDPPA